MFGERPLDRRPPFSVSDNDMPINEMSENALSTPKAPLGPENRGSGAFAADGRSAAVVAVGVPVLRALVLVVVAPIGVAVWAARVRLRGVRVVRRGGGRRARVVVGAVVDRVVPEGVSVAAVCG